ncbi:MAG: hypothetical protein QM784_38105 [Polyangiaceae bacterium]
MKANDESRAVSRSSAEAAPAQVLRLPSVPRPTQEPAPALPGLAAGQVLAFEVETGELVLRMGTLELPARLHSSVEAVVVKRAKERGELVIAQQHGNGLEVIGVLRTSATPGLDVGDTSSLPRVASRCRRSTRCC